MEFWSRSNRLVPISTYRLSLSATDLPGLKEKFDFVGSVLKTVRAMNRILPLVACRITEISPDRTWCGIPREGRAHQFPVPGHGILTFQNLDHHRTRAHELHQFVIERPLFVYHIESPGLFPA